MANKEERRSGWIRQGRQYVRGKGKFGDIDDDIYNVRNHEGVIYKVIFFFKAINWFNSSTIVEE